MRLELFTKLCLCKSYKEKYDLLLERYQKLSDNRDELEMYLTMSVVVLIVLAIFTFIFGVKCGVLV